VKGAVWRRRGVIYEHIADDNAAEKRLDVLATSLEALSAIRRRRRDMEALCSDFDNGDVRMGVVGGCRRRWFGRLGASRTWKVVLSVLGCQSTQK
jgi:hypothetical protein